MQTKKLGRAAAAAGLMVLLLPGVAAASWWDGGYDGRSDNGSSARSGDYESPGETPPPDDNRSPQCGESGCTRYTPPRDDNPPPQCGESGCTRYTPPRDDNPPPQCGQECGAPSPPPPCGQPSCGQGPPPPPPPPSRLFEPIYGCENSDLPDTHPTLHKTTTPPPGTPVRPGDEILVDIAWRVSDFTAPELHKAIDCVYINGVFAPELSGGERLTPNDGHFGFHYFVPLDVPPGSEICDQGFVSGPNGWEEYGRTISNVVCFPVAVPPPPQSCCVSPPVEEATTTTTTTTMPDEEQPYAQSLRYEPEVAPTSLVQPQVLPRTGSGPGAARVAAGGLALLALMRRRMRRG
jgi:hypothetical protein